MVTFLSHLIFIVKNFSFFISKDGDLRAIICTRFIQKARDIVTAKGVHADMNICDFPNKIFGNSFVNVSS